MIRASLLALLACTLLAQNPNTADFPTTVVTEKRLGVAVDRSESELVGDIDSDDLVLTVPTGDAAKFRVHQIITMEDEQMQICGINLVDDELTICDDGRGFSHTTAVSHTDGALIKGNWTEWHTNQPNAEIIAIENILQPNGEGVVRTNADNTTIAENTTTFVPGTNKPAVRLGCGPRPASPAAAGVLHCNSDGNTPDWWDGTSWSTLTQFYSGIANRAFERTGVNFSIDQTVHGYDHPNLGVWVYDFDTEEAIKVTEKVQRTAPYAVSLKADLPTSRHMYIVISGWGGPSGSASPHNVLSATHGDTAGAAAPVLGGVLYANSTPAWAQLAGNTTTTKKVLTQQGNGTISAAPAWNQVTSGHVDSTVVTTDGATTNAPTATMLAANGGNCSSGLFPQGTDASGVAEGCTALPTTIAGTANQISVSAATGPVTISIPNNPTLPGTTSGTFSGNLSGNSTTSTSLAANGSNCLSGNSPLGVDAIGAVEGCFDVMTQTEGDAKVGGASSLGTANHVPYVSSAGALAIDTTAGKQLYRDSSNGRIGIGNAAPATLLDVTGKARVYDSTASTGVTNLSVIAGPGQSSNRLFEVRDGTTDWSSNIFYVSSTYQFSLDTLAAQTTARMQVTTQQSSTTFLGSNGQLGLLLRNRDATNNNWTALGFADGTGITVAGIAAHNTDQTNHYGSLTLGAKGASGMIQTLAVNPDGIAVTGTATVTDDAYAAGWNGSTAVPTKNAVYDKIQALSSADLTDASSVQLWVSPPTTASDACVAGRQAYDASYIYTCVATNTWKRAAHSTW